MINSDACVHSSSACPCLKRAGSTEHLADLDPTATQTALGVELKLEVVALPVSDVDRAKSFYQSLGDGGWMATLHSATTSGRFSWTLRLTLSRAGFGIGEALPE